MSTITTFTRVNLAEALEGYEVSWGEAKCEIEFHHKQFSEFTRVHPESANRGKFNSRDVLVWLGY